MTVIGFRVCRSIGAMLSERPYLTLGGAETFLLFTQEFPLRDFCAFELFGDEDAFGAFEEGFLRPTADAAGRHDLGLMLDCLVWRASADWMRRLGYAAEDVRRVNVRAVERMRRFAETVSAPTLLVGDVGAARRWLQRRPERARRCEPGGGIPSASDRRVGRGRCGSDQRADDDERRRSDRHRSRRTSARRARVRLAHGGNRRDPARRIDPRAFHPRRRRGHRQRPGVLHGQLRPPDAPTPDPRARRERKLDFAPSRLPSQRLHQEPRGARQQRRARRR